MGLIKLNVIDVETLNQKPSYKEEMIRKGDMWYRTSIFLPLLSWTEDRISYGDSDSQGVWSWNILQMKVSPSQTDPWDLALPAIPMVSH